MLRNLIRAVHYAENSTKSKAIQTARQNFEKSGPTWKNIRDFLEHFDEYAEGRGKLQKARKATVYGPYYAESEDRDLSGTLVSTNYYLSFGEGYQLDILTTTKAATALAESVMNELSKS